MILYSFLNVSQKNLSIIISCSSYCSWVFKLFSVNYSEMNNNKIDDQIGTQSNHELVFDSNFQPNCYSSQHFGAQQFSNMGIWVQQPTINQERSQLQNLKPEKSTSTIISRFESPASAFYATEICMRFPQYESQVGYNYNPSLENYDQFRNPIDPSNQTEPNSEIRTSLQPIVKPSQLCSYQYNRPCEKINSIASAQRPYSGDCSSLGSLTHMSFSTQQDQQLSSRHGSVCSASSASSGPVLSSKSRIRWTQDLHEKFVDCINRLGGAEKATPKAILKLMDSDGLTIFHIKSHLQKYRIAKYLPDSAGEKSEKICNIVAVPPQLDVKNGLQIKEALQLQLDVQKRLHEQLEIQRNLQVRIEEQGKQLQMMLDVQQKSTNSFFNTTQTLSNIPPDDDLPSNSLDVGVDRILNARDSGNYFHFPSK